MKTQKCFSPTKENIKQDPETSPSKSSHQVPIQLVRQLLATINSKHINIPSYLDKKLKPYKLDNCIKIQSTQSTAQEDEIKKLKVKINDLQYEKKKLEEDFAQYRHNSKLQREKQVRKWEETCQQLRTSIEDQKESSCYKLSNVEEKYIKEIEDIKNKHAREFKQTVDNLTNSYQNKIQSNQKIFEREYHEIKTVQIEQLSKLNKTICQKQIQLKKIHEQQLRSLALKNKKILDAKEKQYDSRITAVLSEKKTEEKLHEQTKMQASQIKQKLYNQLYYEKKTKNQLEDEIENKCKLVKKLQKQISELGVTIQLQKKSYQEKQKNQQKQFKTEKQKLVKNYEDQMKNIKRYHYQELTKFQSRMQSMENIHSQRETFWENQTQQIVSKLDERPSKKQDLATIEQLKIKLSKKEEESKILMKELRSKMMELQNKEETYNRIFTSSHGNRIEKRSLGRQSFSRENLYKKAQTTDFKFLLKICNKQL